MVQSGATTFSEGEILCKRFRILRFIARGGMGEVYEAEDLSLDLRVALKTVPEHLAQDETALKRFKREITLSRKVTHPNICRVYDLFSHTRPEESNEQLFLTMELLEGESLGRRIRRDGPLTTNEALPILEQIISGLQRAHSEGIIHRDLKSENIFLAAKGEETPRVVIMDFGLAKHFSQAEDETLSLTNGWVGTPAYVSPEQLRGKPGSETSDIYSLGIVMFEMVTGRRPFEASDPISAAVRRLTENPSSPSSFVKNLDPRWEKTILRCLRRNPSERFQRAGDLLRILKSDKTLPVMRRPFPRWPLLLLPLLLIVSGLIWWALPSRLETEARPSLAILGFRCLDTGERESWLAPALTEMLGTELAGNERLRLIPGEEVTKARLGLGIEAGKSIQGNTLEKFHSLVDTGYVLEGTYLKIAGKDSEKIRLDLRIQRAEDGLTVAALSTQGEAGDLFSLVSSSGKEILDRLGIPGTSPGAGSGPALPRNDRAVGLYSQALQQLWSFHPEEARPLLEEALEIESDFPLAHAALARAWMTLGYSENAIREAKIAFESSSELRREERLDVEALYRESRAQWNEATRLYRALWTFYPDNPNYAFDLIRAQLKSGDATAASTSVSELRATKFPAIESRLDLLESEVRQAAADIKGQQRLAARAAEGAQEGGDRLLYGRARLKQAGALWVLGETADARKALDAARRVLQKLGDQEGQFNALISSGVFARDEEKLEEAAEHFKKALELARSLGNIRNQAWATKLLGNLLLTKGELQGAEDYFQRALEYSLESGDRRSTAVIRGRLAMVQRKKGNLEGAKRSYEKNYKDLLALGDSAGASHAATSIAIVLRKQGRPSEAIELLKEALRLKRQGGDRRSMSAGLVNLANIAFDLGRLDEAEDYFQQALDLAREFKRPKHEAFALFGLGEIFRERNKLQLAFEEHSRALMLRQKAKKRGETASSLMALAMLGIDRKDLPAARADAAKALELLREGPSSELNAWADAISARVAIAAGDLPKAEEAINRARRNSGDGSDETIGIFLLLTEARLNIAGGNYKNVRQKLEDCLKRSLQAQQMSTRIESLLMLGLLEEKLKHREISKKHLQRARDLAQEHGYLRYLKQLPSLPNK